MINISGLSKQYKARVLKESDVDQILVVYRQNTLFFQYTDARPDREQVLDDMKITPPGIDATDKYYVGLFDDEIIVAIMDLIDSWPEPEIAYIGLFMMNLDYQGKGIGTAIIDEVAAYFEAVGKKTVRLAIDKGNPQSTHFWKKNGFKIIREADLDGWPKLVAERVL